MEGVSVIHNKEAKQSVLACILKDSSTCDYIFRTIKPQYFYIDLHKTIYNTIQELTNKDIPVDLVSLCEELINSDKLDDIGGSYYLTQLIEMLPTSLNYKNYCKIVKDTYIKRTVNGIALEYGNFDTNKYMGVEALEIVAGLTSRLTMLNEEAQDEETVDYESELLDFIEKRMVEGNAYSGIETGFSKLDKYIGGLEDGSLNIIGARPSVGKSAIAMCMVNNMINRGEKVVLFSLEMTIKELLMRLVSIRKRINGMKIRNASSLSESEYKSLVSCTSELRNKFIHKFDNIIEIDHMCNKIDNLVKDYGIRVVFIDYLQLIRNRSCKSNRNEYIGDICRKLKYSAMKHKICIVLLSQLSRDVEKREDKRPRQSDLRDSGEIEQTASTVMFLHRDTMSDDDSAEMILAKNRNGEVGMIPMVFNKCYTEFMEV